MRADEDLDAFSQDELVAEVKRLRRGIREHRDSSGRSLCWHHPQLWALLPDRSDPLPVVPPWPELLQGCVRYRSSLDAERLPRAKEHVATTMLWRRLDVPGHDACALVELDDGWRLEGNAVFIHEDGRPAALAYAVECNREWASRTARVDGFVGNARFVIVIARAARGDWCLNGVPCPAVRDCVDIDLGFTPATNLLQVRRLALDEGASAEAPVAWLDVAATKLVALPQRYEHRGDGTYLYESPTMGYRASLEVTREGFVREYPGLWSASSTH